jgi:hypothetical protein
VNKEWQDYISKRGDSTGSSYLVIKCINLPSPSKNSWHIARVKSKKKSGLQARCSSGKGI